MGVTFDCCVLSDGSVVTRASECFAFTGATEVYCACFSRDGTRLAVGSKNGRVDIFGVPPSLQRLFSVGRAPAAAGDDDNDGDDDEGTFLLIHSVAFVGDGDALIIASASSVELWSVAADGQMRHRLRDDWAYGVSISPDNKFATAGDFQGSADVWDLTREPSCSRSTQRAAMTLCKRRAGCRAGTASSPAAPAPVTFGSGLSTLRARVRQGTYWAPSTSSVSAGVIWSSRTSAYRLRATCLWPWGGC